MPWRLVRVASKSEPVFVAGVDLWAHAWKPQGEMPLEVPDPRASEKTLELQRYFVQGSGKVVEFAAAELSPGAWLLYAPHPSRATRLNAVRIVSYVAAVAGGFLVVHGYDTSLRLATLGLALFIIGLVADQLAKRALHRGEA